MNPNTAKDQIDLAIKAYELLMEGPVSVEELKEFNAGTLKKPISMEDHQRAMENVIAAHLAARDAIVAALRVELHGAIDKNEKNGNLAAGIAETLRQWAAQDATLEALLEWLKKNKEPKAPEWDKVAEELNKTQKRGPWESSIATDENGRFKSFAVQACFEREVWLGFAPFVSAKPAGNLWLRLVALPWLEERSEMEEDRAKRTQTAKPFSIARVTAQGRHFAKLHKVAAGVSWALGGPAVPRVSLDGKEYATAPTIAAAMVPASFALLPMEYAKKPHQAVLALNEQAEDGADICLAVAVAGSTQYALTPAAGKVGLQIMAAAVETPGEVFKTTLRDLARRINPGDVRLERSHFQTVAKALVQLDRLGIFLPDGMRYRVFECPTPWRELDGVDFDAPIFAGLSRFFGDALEAFAENSGAYKGTFLFEMSGAMSFKRAPLLRQYIRAAAHWNCLLYTSDAADE